MDSLLGSIKWTALSEFIFKLVSFLLGLFVIRRIDPSLYGDYVKAYAVIGFLDTLLTPGLFSLIIARIVESTKEAVQVAWTFDIFIPNIVVFFLFYTSIYINFFDLDKTARIVGLIPLIRSFQSNYFFDLQKKKLFKQYSFHKIRSRFLGLIVSVVMFCLKFDLLSLIVGELIVSLYITSISNYYSLIPGLNLNIRRTFSFKGFSIYASRLMRALRLNADRYLVLPVLTSAELAGYEVANKPNNLIGVPMRSVLNKVFLSYNDESGIKKRVNIVLISTLLISSMIWLIPDSLYHRIGLILFTIKYEAYVQFIKSATLIVVLKSLSSLISTTLISLGCLKQDLMLNILQLVFMLLFAFGVWNGELRQLFTFMLGLELAICILGIIIMKRR